MLQEEPRILPDRRILKLYTRELQFLAAEKVSLKSPQGEGLNPPQSLLLCRNCGDPTRSIGSRVRHKEVIVRTRVPFTKSKPYALINDTPSGLVVPKDSIGHWGGRVGEVQKRTSSEG